MIISNTTLKEERELIAYLQSTSSHLTRSKKASECSIKAKMINYSFNYRYTFQKPVENAFKKITWGIHLYKLILFSKPSETKLQL